MILAAGLGTRLRPITNTTPKPLLPLDGITLIDQQILYLKKFGIDDIIINLHHLGAQIENHVGDGSEYGVKVTYSNEPEILGTGGGIKNAMDFFGEEPFVVINCDALMNADMGAIIEKHLDSGLTATMVMKEQGVKNVYTSIDVSPDGLVSAFGGGRYFYTGLQVLTKEFLKTLPEAGKPSCLIMDGYMKALSEGEHVGAFIYDGYWNDLGTPERYEQAKDDIREGLMSLETN